MWFAEGQQGELGRRRINARGSGVRGKNGRGACLSRAESGEPREAARHVFRKAAPTAASEDNTIWQLPVQAQ